FNPQFAHESKAEEFLKTTPVYSKIEGVPPETLKKYIASVFETEIAVKDPLPAALREKYSLLSRGEALEKIHFPCVEEDVLLGKARIKFEEALKINVGIMNNRSVNGISKITIENFEILKRFIKGLPFELTKSQLEVIEDILNDFKKECVMNRLVQGDVGSGKTIVAVACAYLMALNGYQTAYMAPTEILANQHADNFKTYLEPYGI
ncbi:MAG: DEAD/DEAH box helicase, partial [Eubacterium sp.]